MKKTLLMGVISLVVLSGCGTKKTSGSGSDVQKAKKSSNSVVCTRSEDLNYYDVEALKEQEAGTYQDGAEIISREEYAAEEEERNRKKSIKAGTITQDYIYEFNKEGNKIEKVYQMVTSTYTHEEVTDSMLKANKEYLEDHYKKDTDYASYNVYIDGKTVVRELTMNMDKVSDKSKLNITKQELVLQASYTSKDGVSTVCTAN